MKSKKCSLETGKQWASQCCEDGLLAKRTSRLLESLTSQLRGLVGKRHLFKRDNRVMHLANGMLHLDDPDLVLQPFSAQYYSRNPCPIAWDPDAQCPKFLKFLKAGLDDDDVSLMQRCGGAMLLGGNAAQRIFILTGTPDGGKSTVVEIFERVQGLKNVYELRTKFLHERFELARYISKSTLTGKDVPGDFLEHEGAQVLKKLVGMTTCQRRKKDRMKDIPLYGNFLVIITCNSRLRVRLDGDNDTKAWMRRLIVIEYAKAPPKKRILGYSDILLNEEGPGMLRWMVEGGQRYLTECHEDGDFALTPA